MLVNVFYWIIADDIFDEQYVHLFEYKKVYKSNENHSKINWASLSDLLSYRLIGNCATNEHVRNFISWARWKFFIGVLNAIQDNNLAT